MGRTKRKKKRNTGEKLEWATAHFQHWVATQQVVSRPGWLVEQARSDTAATLAAARTTWAGSSRDMGQAVGCHDTVWCHDLVGRMGVATYSLVSRHESCRESYLGLATHFLVSRHGSSHSVSRHNF